MLRSFSLHSLAVLGLLWGAPDTANAAAKLSVETTLSDNAVLVGDIVTVQVRAVARAEGPISLQIPRIKGLSEISRSKSEGTSISWTGAGQQITREYNVNIEYQADKVGTITIPPVIAKLGSTSAKSRPTKLRVTPSSAGPAQAGETRPGEVAPPQPSEQQLFVRYRVDKSEAFIGEQIILDLELFAGPRGRFSLEQVGSPPEFDGFWRETLEQPSELKGRTQRVAGQRYTAYRVWRVALFGLKAGELTIDPTSLTFSQGRSIFNTGKRVRRRSVPIKLTIKPLPTIGRPPDFSNNNIGEYRLSASVDHHRVPAGKAVLLTVRMQGRGNIKSVRLPKIGQIDGFRVFSPTIKDQPQSTLAGLRGEKRAEILLMPTRGGRLEIPSFSLPIFDPIRGEYRRLTTRTIRVAVQGDPSAMAPPPSVLAPAEAKPKKTNLKPLRYRSDLRTRPLKPWSRGWVWGALLLPPALFLLFMVARVFMQKKSAQSPASLDRAAARASQAHLSAATEAKASGDYARAYAEFSEAILALASQKVGQPLRGLTQEAMQTTLSERGLSPELTASILQEMEAADYARFAPGTLKDADIAIERWGALLAELERWKVEEVNE